MTQQDQRLPIRSKDERARDQVAVVPAGDSGPSRDGDGSLAEVRQLAHSLGYTVRREPRSRRPRPETRDGRVSTTCRLHPDVRSAMEQARLELNLTYSDMINAGVIMFLESQHLRVGVDPQQFLPSG